MADDKKNRNEEILAAITLANQDEEKTLDQIVSGDVDDEKSDKVVFPGKLGDVTLEKEFVGLLLNQVKAISVYNFKFEDCFFANEDYLNLYKKVLFTDGEKYAPIAI